MLLWVNIYYCPGYTAVSTLEHNNCKKIVGVTIISDDFPKKLFLMSLKFSVQMKLQAKASKLIKKEAPVQMFFRSITKFLRTPFLQNTSGRLRLNIKDLKATLTILRINIDLG